MLRLNDHLSDADMRKLDLWPVTDPTMPLQSRLRMALQNACIEVMAYCPECSERDAAISHVEHAFKCAISALGRQASAAGDNVSSKKSS